MDDKPKIPPHWIREEAIGPSEVGRVFSVDPRTVTKWATSGLIGFFRTPHGMRRFPMCEVERLMAGQPPEDPELLIALAKEDAKSAHARWRGGWRRGEREGEAPRPNAGELADE